MQLRCTDKFSPSIWALNSTLLFLSLPREVYDSFSSETVSCFSSESQTIVETTSTPAPHPGEYIVRSAERICCGEVAQLTDTKHFHLYPSADRIAFTTCVRNTRSKIERVVQNLIHINKFIRESSGFLTAMCLLFSGPNFCSLCVEDRGWPPVLLPSE